VLLLGVGASLASEGSKPHTNFASKSMAVHSPLARPYSGSALRKKLNLLPSGQNFFNFLGKIGKGFFFRLSGKRKSEV
jgi:hypothetical protein